MNEDVRPDSESILRAIQRNEERAHKGNLRIFFGMSAGVGKTYAMLLQAQERLREGVDLVIGYVVTHKRPKTEELLKNMPIFPRKVIDYKGVSLEEFDLDALLIRKPKIVVIDELPHTNIPGSRHQKRWQDILEILDHGIDVYTAINVQHLESRKEIVEAIAGIKVLETVPDSFVEKAHQLDLIDVDPIELLKRMKQGDVYLGDVKGVALENFFKIETLTALREIALRFVAEKVDYELQTLIASKSLIKEFRTKDKLIVIIEPGFKTASLIRVTRQRAFNLEAPWIGLYVDTGKYLNEDEKLTLAQNMSLARQLGAEVITVVDPDFFEGLRKVVLSKNVTELVLDQPELNWKRYFQENLVKKINEKVPSLYIFLFRASGVTSKKKFFDFNFNQSKSSIFNYLIVFAFQMLTLFSAYFLHYEWKLIDYNSVALVFLFSTIFTSLRVSRGPILFSAFLSLQLWNFFFIPPTGTFAIKSPEDWIMTITYLIVAVIIGSLTSRVKLREELLKIREEKQILLYEIVSIIVTSESKDECLEKVTQVMNKYLKGTIAINLKASDGTLSPFKKGSDWWFNRPKEWTVAEWTFANGKVAGWSTNTLPSARAIYVPLKAKEDVWGVLAFKPQSHDNDEDEQMETKSKMTVEEEDFLHTVCRQLSIYLEREFYQAKVFRMAQLEESERLHQSLLNSISHEIKTPLAAIMTQTALLKSTSSNNSVVLDLEKAVWKLNKMVSNILDMSRIRSGMLKPNFEWVELDDVVNQTLRLFNLKYDDERIVITFEKNLPLLYIDTKLIEQALFNLISNALQYSGAKSKVTISGIKLNSQILLTIEDKGQGIPLVYQHEVFKPFFRVPGSLSFGSGLGLAISKSYIEMNEGDISIKSNPGEGTTIHISFPIKSQT